MRLAVFATSLLLVPLSANASPKAESVTLRGQPQTLHVYGARGGPVALLASGDGGWTHLALTARLLDAIAWIKAQRR